MELMDRGQIERSLGKLAEVYEALGGPPLKIFVCGGAALLVMELVDRAKTKDIDLVAPVDLPPQFFEAADIIGKEFGLPLNWINQGPKQLTEMGLPEGFEERACVKRYGPRLTCCFASRLDQIFFKTYASVDRGGYHVDDLLALKPADEELVEAARWCMKHDVSETFKDQIRDMFEKLGFSDAGRAIQ